MKRPVELVEAVRNEIEANGFEAGWGLAQESVREIVEDQESSRRRIGHKNDHVSQGFVAVACESWVSSMIFAASQLSDGTMQTVDNWIRTRNDTDAAEVLAGTGFHQAFSQFEGMRLASVQLQEEVFKRSLELTMSSWHLLREGMPVERQWSRRIAMSSPAAKAHHLIEIEREDSSRAERGLPVRHELKSEIAVFRDIVHSDNAAKQAYEQETGRPIEAVRTAIIDAEANLDDPGADFA